MAASKFTGWMKRNRPSEADLTWEERDALIEVMRRRNSRWITIGIALNIMTIWAEMIFLISAFAHHHQ